jgi:hypothetical protein
MKTNVATGNKEEKLITSSSRGKIWMQLSKLPARHSSQHLTPFSESTIQGILESASQHWHAGLHLRRTFRLFDYI